MLYGSFQSRFQFLNALDRPDTLRALRAPWLPLSSGEALEQLLAVLPDDAVDRLRGARVLAASPRLAALARP